MAYSGITRHLAALLAAAAIFLPAQARATYPGDDVAECLCAETLERLICKADRGFSYLGKRRNRVFIYNGFYASKHTNFICTVTDATVIIENPEWIRLQRAVSYTVDPDTGCASAAYYSDLCHKKPEFTCCPRKRHGSKALQQEQEFWGKPVPGDLPDKEAMDKATEKGAGFWAKPLSEKLEFMDKKKHPESGGAGNKTVPGGTGK